MKNILLFFLILFLCVFNLTAQQPVFISYPAEKHPAVSDKISGLYTNGLDFIWLATDNGLMRFDGLQFSAINSENTVAPTAITRDSVGILWIANGKTLSYIDNSKSKSASYSKDTLSHPVNALFACNSNLWIATAGGGITIITKDNIVLVNTASGLTDDYVYCL